MVEAPINSSNSNNVDNLQHTPVSSEDDDDTKDKGGDEFVEGGYSTSEPSVNDVLCGRGGSINSHPGNERFRILVEKRKRVYLTARFKREKRLIACSIVSEIRALDPPGRFLSKDTKSGLWKDIGDEKARDKTSQALRENAPSIRAEIETEICEKRAEMMLTQQQQTKEETTTRVNAPLHLPPQPQHGMLPPPVHPYYGAWGYPFYGYGVPPVPPQLGHGPVPIPAGYPPHHPAMMMAPPPPGHYDPYYPHGYAGTTPDPYLHQRQQQPPLVPPQTTTASSTPQPNVAPKPASPHSTKSALEQTTEFVASGAESLKNWTKRSFNIGSPSSTTNGANGSAIRGGTGTSSSSGGVGAGVSTAPSHEGSKTIITYKHDDETKKRRMVKFRDDDSSSNFSQQRVRGRRVRPCYSPLNVNGNDSLVDQLDDDVYEPEKLEDYDTTAENVVGHHRASSSSNHTFIAQMTQLLSPSLMGSWDLGNIVCGNDTSDPVPFHRRQFKDTSDPQDMYESYPGDDDNDAIEWEGQEVQLVDESKNSANTPRHYDDDRRYPPERTPKSNSLHPSTNDNASSIAFSSLGSCHSWIPEQFGTAASYFGRGGGIYDDEEAEEIATSGGSGSGGGVGTKSCGSHDMTEFSAGGNSVGGNSLARVFDNHPPPSPTNDRYLLDSEKTGYMASPNMNHRVLSRIPSWERNLRSKSPLSIASEDDEGDDEDDQFDTQNTNTTNNDGSGTFSTNIRPRRHSVRLNSEPSTPIATNDPMSPTSYHHPSYFLSSPTTAGIMAAIRSIDEEDMAFG